MLPFCKRPTRQTPPFDLWFEAVLRMSHPGVVETCLRLWPQLGDKTARRVEPSSARSGRRGVQLLAFGAPRACCGERRCWPKAGASWEADTDPGRQGQSLLLSADTRTLYVSASLPAKGGYSRRDLSIELAVWPAVNVRLKRGATSGASERVVTELLRDRQCGRVLRPITTHV